MRRRLKQKPLLLINKDGTIKEKSLKALFKVIYNREFYYYYIMNKVHIFATDIQ